MEKDDLQVTGVGVGAVRGESGDCLVRRVRGILGGSAGLHAII